MTAPAVLRLATSLDAPHKQVEMVREVFGRQMLRLDVEPFREDDFHVDLTLRALPGLKWLTGRVNGLETPRTASLLGDGNDDIFLTGVLEGRMIGDQRGERVVLDPGAVHLVSNAERFSYTHLHSRAFGVLAPRAAIGALVPDLDDRIARPLPRDPGGMHLLRGYIAALATGGASERPESAATAVTHLHDLIAHIIGSSVDGAERIATRGLKAARLLAAKAHIRCNLADPSLSLDTVAAAGSFNRRYLQRLFEGEATSFSAYVTEQRLARADAMLRDPRHAARPIIALAYECGFGDITHFNRQFRHRFGMTPSDLRATGSR